MFRENYPAAWTFHKNTERSATNLLSLNERQLPEASFKEYLNSKNIILPEPLHIKHTFNDILGRRTSCRTFCDVPLSLDALSTILFYGYGIKEKSFLNGKELLNRFVPSGGGLYSLELYLIIKNVVSLKPGIYHYLPLNHSLEFLQQVNIPLVFIAHLFLDQQYVVNAGAFIIACSMLNRCMQKYEDRGYRYILFEAGHVFQNINLCAAGLNIGGLNMGGFYDADVISLLRLDDEREVPLYAMALGNVDKAFTNISGII